MSDSDPQFGVSRILRPFSGFEAVYQGAAANRMIMLTQGGQALDPRAGEQGYSSVLVRGLAVPLGSRVLIWLPLIEPAVLGVGAVEAYNYRLIWRLRNVFDYRKAEIPFHYPKQGAGVADAGSPRVILPTAWDSIVYNQTESATVDASVPQHDRIQDIQPHREDTILGAEAVLLPYVSAGPVVGQIQQGILGPATFGNTAYKPIFIPYEVRALGDELLIGVWRGTGTLATWAFDGGQYDNAFSRILGAGDAGGPYPDLGAYVHIGSAA